MGAVGGLLGTGGGAGGTGFAGPQMARLDNPTNMNQIGDAYAGTQNSLAQQQALLAAIQQQNGLGNQTQVYNQLQGIANGTGPNPAQAMLNQSTGQNVANQAALMAGQRGVGSNVGLAARQIGQQGAGIQQNSAGQAATLQAQQSLGALGAAGNLANTQAANQIAATGANTNANLALHGSLMNAQNAYNNAQSGMQGNVNSANAGLANTQMGGFQSMFGGAMGGAGAALGLADGGAVPDVTGAAVGSIAQPMAMPQSSGPQSSFGQFVNGMGSNKALNEGMNSFASGVGSAMKSKPAASGIDPNSVLGSQAPGGSDIYSSSSYANNAMNLHGGQSYAAPNFAVGLMNQPTAMAVPGLACGGNVGSMLQSGGNVPGQARVSGNSSANDTVSAKLSPGELVIDRETMKSPGKDGQAARFLAAVIAQKKKAGK